MAARSADSDSRAQSASARPGAPERAVAVALSDQPAAGRPTIIASGYGTVAERILAIAFDAGVKVREDADLAEVLAALDIGCEIPLEAFAAVAEILSYVYRANDEARASRGQPAASHPSGAMS